MRIRRNQRAANAPSARMAARATALTTAAAFAAAGATLGLMSLTGCGGGGDDNNGGGSSPSPSSSSSGGPVSPSPSPSTITRNYSVRINWGARSRDVLAGALSSAISARIGISRSTTVNTPNGPDWIEAPFVVNRNAAPAAYANTYTSPNQVAFDSSQPQYLIVTFHAQPDGNGPLVGYCILPAAIDASSGNLLGNVQVIGSIATVEVVPNQVFFYNQSADLAVVTKTATGFVIPITPGSVFPTVAGGSDRLGVDSDGRLRGLRPGTATVRAVVDSVSSTPVGVSVTSNAAVTVAPATPSISWEEQQQFTATVANAPDQSVTWTVTPNDPNDTGDVGTITAGGVYTAPKRNGTFKITATSVFDPGKSNTTTITVSSQVGVAVAPTTGNLEWEKTLKFDATVTRAKDTSVTWTVEPTVAGDTGPVGTVSTDGTYTSPKRDGVYRVVATSKYDPTKTGSALVTVKSLVSVTVSPNPARVAVKKQITFNATVDRSPDTSVTWSVALAPGQTGNPGTIDPVTGVYSAPAKRVVVIVTATSNYDTSKSGSSTLTVEAGGADVIVN